MKKYGEAIAFIVLVLLSYFAIFTPFILANRATPAGTQYTFGAGFLPDYFQYLGWVKDGLMGQLLLSSRYTEVVYPGALIHPFFALVGLAGKLAHENSAITLYIYARLLTLAIFFLAFFRLLKRSFSQGWQRMIAIICFLSTTGFWTVNQTAGSNNLVEAIPWSGNFNVIGKINIPPHHLLALTAMIMTLIFLSQKNKSKLTVLFMILGTLATGLFNPSTLTVLIFIFLGGLFLGFLPVGKEPATLRRYFMLLLIISSPLILYDLFVFRSLPPWSVMYFRMQHFDPPVTLVQYLLACGPTLILGLIGLTRGIYRKPLILFLALWALIPFFIFPIHGILQMNSARLFQSYQCIPLSILAVFGIIRIAELFKKFISYRLTVVVLSLSLILYAVPPFFLTFSSGLVPPKPYYFNIYAPDALLATFNFLDKETPPLSVVLAGETVSTMIPAYTHNRTVIARDDIAFDYYDKQALVFKFFDGKMTESEAKKFLSDHHISFILFGIDTVPFTSFPLATAPFFHEVYKNNGTSIVVVE